MRTFLALGAFLFAPGLAAQPVFQGTSCTLYDRDGVAVSGPPLEMGTAPAFNATVTQGVSRGSATFLVDYTGFTAQAQAAFQHAVDIWSTHISSPVPIRVKATFASLGASTLGSAGPFLTANTPGLPHRSTWYPFALADARAGSDQFPGASDYDIEAEFSSSRTDWYFGTDGNPPSGRYDFATVVLHELGHGLGFIGSGSYDNGTGSQECSGTGGTGCWGLAASATSPTWAFAFDRFVQDSQSRSILNTTVYGNPSNALGALYQSGALLLDSPEVARLLGGKGRLHAPFPFKEGSSFSHWDEAVYPRGTSRALMTPQVATAEAYQDPGDLTCAVLGDMGWTLGDDCLSLTVDDERGPSASGLSLSLSGANPFRTVTTVRVRRDVPGVLRATLVDVLGREVAVLHDGPAGGDLMLRVAPASVGAGVYHVVVEAEGVVRTMPVTFVR